MKQASKQASNQSINQSTPPLPTPSRISSLANGQPPIDVPIEHLLDQLNVRARHDPRDAQLVVEDLVAAVKGVFLVDEGVEEDAEGPDVLLLAAVGFALEDFGRGVVWSWDVSWGDDGRGVEREDGRYRLSRRRHQRDRS